MVARPSYSLNPLTYSHTSCSPVRCAGASASRKVSRNHVGSRLIGSPSLSAFRSSCERCTRSHSFCSDGLATAVSRRAIGCVEPSKAFLGSWHSRAAYRVTTISSNRVSSRRWLYTNSALSRSKDELADSGSIRMCPSAASSVPPIATMWLTVLGASSSHRGSRMRAAMSVSAEHSTIVILCPPSRESRSAAKASSWPPRGSSSCSGARYGHASNSYEWISSPGRPPSDPFATGTSCAPSALRVPFASRARLRLSPRLATTVKSPISPVRRMATAITSAFSSSWSLPKSPTMSMSVATPSCCAPGRWWSHKRPNHSPEPGPIDVATRKCNSSLTFPPLTMPDSFALLPMMSVCESGQQYGWKNIVKSSG
mmetsp:Transcript_8636/g.21324  ORF Transcript_8636/g.21324 Transcript_8636/m.21324 type:complete len:369 (-) Transcript_8636:1283-2389(-)